MSLRDLEYLVAVADHGTFRRAAAACEVSQPTLSTQVKKLEADLGAVLVDRASVPARLTPIGEEVVRRARRLLRDAAELRAAVRAAAEPEAGTLRLGVFPTIGAYLLPLVIGRIRERFPKVNLTITEEKSADLLGWVTGGELDAAILSVPVAGEGLTSLPLFREDFLLAAPVGHPLSDADTPITARRVAAGAEIMLLSAGHCLGEQVDAWLTEVGGQPRPDHRATSVESLRSMIAAGTGVSLIPALAVRSPAALSDAMVTRPVVQPTPHRELGLVWRTGSARTDLLTALAPMLVPSGMEHVHPLLTAD